MHRTTARERFGPVRLIERDSDVAVVFAAGTTRWAILVQSGGDSPKASVILGVPNPRVGFGRSFRASHLAQLTVTESRDPTVFVQSTQFAPPPAPITGLVPTAEQLTALYNATTNYSIREEDRARLLEGPSGQALPIARAWGAQPSPQYIQFTTVEPVGPDMINATGQGHIDRMAPYPVGPIPFVRFNNEWKLSRAYVCGILTVFANLPDPRPSAQTAYQCE